jgi:hypothetical protein
MTPFSSFALAPMLIDESSSTCSAAASTGPSLALSGSTRPTFTRPLTSTRASPLACAPAKLWSAPFSEPSDSFTGDAARYFRCQSRSSTRCGSPFFSR